MSLRLESLRSQVFALVLALAIPAIALEMWWGYQEYRSAGTQASLEALATAERTSVGVQQFLATAGEMMTGVARVFRQNLEEPEGCANLVEVLTDVLPYFANTLVLDADGTLVCSAAPAPTVLAGLPLPAVTESGSGTLPAVGLPLLDQRSGTWVLPVAVFTPAEGTATARTLMGLVPLLQFQELLRGVDFDDSYLVTIATADLQVITRSTDVGAWVGQILPGPTGEDRVLVEGGRVATGPDADDVQRAWGIAEIPGLGWSVFVGVPEREVNAPALIAAMKRVGLTAFFLLAGFLFATWTYRRIAAALSQLVEGARHAERGHQIALPEGTPAEVSEVVTQFNRTLASRDAAEAAEHRALERYASIFNEAVFGIFVATPEGRVLDANPALATMLGYREIRPLLDAPLRDHFQDPDQHDVMLARCLAEGSLEAYVTEWIRRDGKAIVVRIDGQVVQTDDGGEGVEMIVDDITEELRRDLELRQTQKMEAVGRLAGGIAHDFNNLLTVISANTELALESLPEKSPTSVDLMHVKGAASRATQLTRQLLAFSRDDGSGVRDVDVNQVIAELEAMLLRLIGADIRLETSLDPEVPRVHADPSRLEQIVMNLVLNARDAVSSGGSIRIATRTVPTGSEGPMGPEPGVTIKVHDDGIGMDPDIRARIFEPFFTTKDKTRGTGLGLATVYGIVEQSGGRIDVESEVGVGTTFRIWLPAAR
ncbi:MAG: ATP-binding protein [Gemmatimonadota bacterium]